MNDNAEMPVEPGASLPPILRAEHESAPFARRTWYTTIGPAYLGLLVWAPFFDSLWIGDLTRFPLPWLVASAVVASSLCSVFLYYVPASWGLSSRQPLGIVAASTFGTLGSEWLTGVAVGIACIVWYAVAIDYAVDSTLLGLRACGLIAAESLAGWSLGPVTVKSPVYLTTALFWIYITGTSGLWKITGVVVALMKVYAPVALLLLTSIAIMLLPGPGMYDQGTAALIAERVGFREGWRNHASVVELMTGFFAMAGLVSADWGGSTRRRLDVVLGGLAGVVLAASWTAIMSLLVVAGAIARVRYEVALWPSHDTSPLTFRWGIYYGIGGIPGGAILILFGLAALAPACYSAWVYGQKLSTHWPLMGPTGWTWIGGAIAIALGATSYASQIEWIFFGMGVVFAPVVGALAADWVRQRGEWAGVRPGVNRAGLIAWGAGLGIAVAVEVGRADSLESAPWWYSSAICGFVASFACYSLLVRMGHEALAMSLSPHEAGQSSPVVEV